MEVKNITPENQKASTINTQSTVLHKAATRGHADHGWLKTYHTFSFANYHDDNRMHFGVLRVLNDDFVAAGMGFSTHPHSNMEIITIPLEGVIEHKDSMGSHGIIASGEIQVMSAGTGITHSEFNHSKTDDLKLLQIWVFPNKGNVTPRYDQMVLPASERNTMQQVLSPNADDSGVWIHQDAWFHIGNLDQGIELKYELNKPASNGVYAFVIEGDVTINGQTLNRRDGFGIWDVTMLDIKADSEAKLLLMEVPMGM